MFPSCNSRTKNADLYVYMLKFGDVILNAAFYCNLINLGKNSSCEITCDILLEVISPCVINPKLSFSNIITTSLLLRLMANRTS